MFINFAAFKKIKCHIYNYINIINKINLSFILIIKIKYVTISHLIKINHKIIWNEHNYKNNFEKDKLIKSSLIFEIKISIYYLLCYCWHNNDNNINNYNNKKIVITK